MSDATAESEVAGAGLMEGDDFFEAADYIGAFDPTGSDWTAGWTYFGIE